MDRADLAGDAARLKAASGGGHDLVVDATGSADRTVRKIIIECRSDER